jgi:hypothetical protein
VRRANDRRLLALLLALLAAAAGGCTRAVAGTPVAAPQDALPLTATVTPGPPAAGPPGGTARDPTPTTPVALQPDVLADECLLDAGQLAALLGRPVRAPAQSVIRWHDGSRRTGCYVAAAGGGAAPVAAINVYRVRTGTPAQFVATRAAGGRRLTGIGEGATVLDTVAGPTLQVASGRFVVTVVVRGRDPGDAAWRAAARHALARLPA